MNKEYLIWSIEHNSWWGPNWCGYVHDPTLAGRYGHDEASKIVQQANVVEFNECMIPVNMIFREDSSGTAHRD